MKPRRTDEEIDVLLARGGLAPTRRDAILANLLERSQGERAARWRWRWAFAGLSVATTAVVLFVAAPWRASPAPTDSRLRAKGSAGQAELARPAIKLECLGGTLVACPTGSMLVVHVSGARGHVSAWAEPTTGGERIWYFSAENGAPLVDGVADNAAVTGRAVKIGREHRPGTYVVEMRVTEREMKRGDLLQLSGHGLGDSTCFALHHVAMKLRVLIGLVCVCVPLPAYAASAFFSLAIGYNGLPPDNQAAGASVLSFADDDALAVHELARTVARKSLVLALPDRATQNRNPASIEARPPSLAELRRALAELHADIARATEAGEETSVWLYYSGHGWLDEQGRANLTLVDGALSQDLLYDEVLPALFGRTVHLMLDACHAEALLRPRDLTAETVALSPSEVATASLRRRLDHLPNVGVLMASTSSTQAHEWDDYQTGIFTHRILSGLRGGADVNGDGRIEYSELAAFLAAANRAITNPRARLTSLVAAPKLYPRATLLDLREAAGLAHLHGRAHHLGRLQVDDAHGRRLLDLRAESGFVVDLRVPAGETILLSNDIGEKSVPASTSSPINLETVTLGERRVRSRSAVTESLRRGLFATEFGPAYYVGYVDRPDSSMLPVELAPAGVRLGPASPAHPASAWAAFGVSAASLAATGVLAVLAVRAYGDVEDTALERPSMAARDRYEGYRSAALAAAAVFVASAAIGYWLW